MPVKHVLLRSLPRQVPLEKIESLGHVKNPSGGGGSFEGFIEVLWNNAYKRPYYLLEEWPWVVS